jgi:signal transduction histidine kinase
MLLNLVNDMMDYAKFESGNFEIYHEKFDLT